MRFLGRITIAKIMASTSGWRPHVCNTIWLKDGVEQSSLSLKKGCESEALVARRKIAFNYKERVNLFQGGIGGAQQHVELEDEHLFLSKQQLQVIIPFLSQYTARRLARLYIQSNLKKKK